MYLCKLRYLVNRCELLYLLKLILPLSQVFLELILLQVQCLSEFLCLCIHCLLTFSNSSVDLQWPAIQHVHRFNVLFLKFEAVIALLTVLVKHLHMLVNLQQEVHELLFSLVLGHFDKVFDVN